EPDSFQVLGLACHSNLKRLASQVREFQPDFVCLDQPDLEAERLFPHLSVLTGESGLVRLATLPEADLILVAIPGITSLVPVLESLRCGKTVALATKEIMVVAGSLIMETARRHQATILPVDSEHNALFQCLAGENRDRVARVYLTASGGPFLNRKDLENVLLEQVLAHPVWKMGRKITVDSATLMNKALEMIEAHHLFGLPPEKIAVLIHREAIVHGLVEFTDGVFKAVLSPPDMKFALSHVLHYPDRAQVSWKTLRLEEVARLTFRQPGEKDGWLALARRALKEGGSVPVVLNGANEEAVSLFLQRRIKFNQIIPLVEKVLKEHTCTGVTTVEEVIHLNNWARNRVRSLAGVS
ncbi:MAG TPA: 1-deoxy-D-xylulose-5-phosphate reductoisomerase, partial [bacterium]|nr:1-deoxy-D-xylulose-5-phosphate reductoisomerase [bacterium]